MAKKKRLDKRQVVLIIMDGWGCRREKAYNAISSAKTPNIDCLMRTQPNSRLDASGNDVGLPKGFIGNSEVGHLNIGAGRIVKEMIAEIDDSIKEGSFFRKRAFLDMIRNCQKYGSKLHLMGLIQMEGVHAMSTHLAALLRLCRMEKFDDVVIHAFTDGRDSPPRSAARQVKIVRDAIRKHGVGRFVTVTGRYYAMDRDKRWDRTKIAYDCIMDAKGKRCRSINAAIKESYSKGISDEFIRPRVIDGYDGVNDHDSIIMFNYRLDRARQLTHAIIDPDFKEFKTRKPKGLMFCSMDEYYKEERENHNVKIAFPRSAMKNILGEWLSLNKKTQLRCAETEKFAHVTYFFNGQREKPFPGEDRKLVPSPKVATYDLKPEMSAYEIRDIVCRAIEARKYDFIAVNFANADMVGHTGNLKAAIKAVETVDSCIGSIIDALDGVGCALIIADHGNCEVMSGQFKTSHTTNKVPCILVGCGPQKLRDGRLADVAPTILHMIGMKKPKEMTGQSLIEK